MYKIFGAIAGFAVFNMAVDFVFLDLYYFLAMSEWHPLVRVFWGLLTAVFCAIGWICGKEYQLKRVES